MAGALTVLRGESYSQRYIPPRGELLTMVLPGKELASQLEAESRGLAVTSPIDPVIEAAASGSLTDDQLYRLLGQLWALERMYYYVYGAWGSSLVVNQYPPSVDYLFSKQVYDDSTHEMLYCQAIIQKGWAKGQRLALRHPYCQFPYDSGIAVFIGSMRSLGIYAHNLRLPALNLGAKPLELGWLERMAEAMSDPYMKGLFASQMPETRSHVQMGRFVAERFVSQAVDVELCRAMTATARNDYNSALSYISDFVLGNRTPSTLTQLDMPDVD